MLNACRRHGSFHSRVPRRPRRPSIGAQRLSASWIVSRDRPEQRRHEHVVLNACRRHGSFHDCARRRSPSDGLVLNACRRHGSFHDGCFPFATAIRMCSTPVGVMDRFTGHAASSLTFAPGAQRLSASWIVSLPGVHVCGRLILNVLNACRRHGSFHSRTKLAVTGLATRAQRLSASWIVSLRSFDGINPMRTVLNACRRHGSFHICQSWRDRGLARVLNACRRHGSFHRRSGTGLCTSATVLNACRRHGSFHVILIVEDKHPEKCSTPVGVMDRFTLIRRANNGIRLGCSTPVGVMDRFTGTW